MRWKSSTSTWAKEPSARAEHTSAVAALGDLDADGNVDLAVGTALQHFWILRLNSDGTVKAQQEIAPGVGGFVGPLVPAAQNFGSVLAPLGDVDGDGIPDLAVGAPSLTTCTATCPAGSLWILFLNADGTVKAERELTDGQGGIPPGTLAPFDAFGSAAAVVGDLDGDGTKELAVGASMDASTGLAKGAVHFLSLAADGTVTPFAKLDAAPFGGLLSEDSEFGASLAALGDHDGDGVEDLLVGAPGRDRGLSIGPNGVAFVVFLNADGTLEDFSRIGSGGFVNFDRRELGRSVASVGDRNGDGVGDVAIGSPLHDGLGGFVDVGAVWIVYLNSDGSLQDKSVITHTHLSALGQGTVITAGDRFGAALASLPDLDGAGCADDLAVGAIWDEAGSTGTLYNLFLGPELQASRTTRNAGANPLAYTSDVPVLGATIQLTVNTSLSGHGNALPFGFDTPIQVMLGGGQTLLAIDFGGNGEYLALAPKPGPLAVFSFAVPNDPSCCGKQIYTQSILFGDVFPFGLSNAQDWVLGN